VKPTVLHEPAVVYTAHDLEVMFLAQMLEYDDEKKVWQRPEQIAVADLRRYRHADRRRVGLTLIRRDAGERFARRGELASILIWRDVDSDKLPDTFAAFTSKKERTVLVVHVQIDGKWEEAGKLFIPVGTKEGRGILRDVAEELSDDFGRPKDMPSRISFTRESGPPVPGVAIEGPLVRRDDDGKFIPPPGSNIPPEIAEMANHPTHRVELWCDGKWTDFGFARMPEKFDERREARQFAKQMVRLAQREGMLPQSLQPGFHKQMAKDMRFVRLEG
jgi:hypothetical protein